MPGALEIEKNKQAELRERLTPKPSGATFASTAINISKQQSGTVFLTFADAVNRTGSVGACFFLLAFAVVWQCSSACLLAYAVEATGATSYPDLWTKVLGQKTSFFVSFSIALNAGFGCISYGIVVKEYTGRFIFFVFGMDGTENMSLLVAAIGIFFPLAMLRELNMLRHTSLMGQICCVIAMSFVIYQLVEYWDVQLESRACQYGDIGKDSGCSAKEVLEVHNHTSIGQMVGVCPLFIASMMVHYNIPRFYHEYHVKSAREFSKAVAAGFGICMVIYTVFAFGGFLRMGTNKPSGNLIKFYDHDHEVDTPFESRFVTLIWLLMAMQVSASYPLLFNPMRRSLLSLVGYDVDKISNDKYTLVTVVLVAFTVVVAAMDFDLTFVMGIKGAICGTFLCFIAPGLILYSTRVTGTKVRLAWSAALITMGTLIAIKGLMKTFASASGGRRLMIEEWD
jgi:amino acid permease